MKSDIQHLQETLHQQIPLTMAMGVTVQEYAGQSLRLHATLKGNTNIHGAAFAGSLYSLASLAAWGLLYLRLLSEDLKPRIVIGESSIRYVREVRSDIVAEGTIDAAEFARFFKELKNTGKSTCSLQTTISYDGKLAVNYTGSHVAFLT